MGFWCENRVMHFLWSVISTVQTPCTKLWRFPNCKWYQFFECRKTKYGEYRMRRKFSIFFYSYQKFFRWRGKSFWNSLRIYILGRKFVFPFKKLKLMSFLIKQDWTIFKNHTAFKKLHINKFWKLYTALPVII